MTTAYPVLVCERERLDAELRGLATDIGFEQVWLGGSTGTSRLRASSAGVDESLGAALGVLRRAGEDPKTLVCAG